MELFIVPSTGPALFDFLWSRKPVLRPETLVGSPNSLIPCDTRWEMGPLLSLRTPWFLSPYSLAAASAEACELGTTTFWP